MIIRSQDKKSIITDLNLQIYADDWSDKFGIMNSNGAELGLYSTEKKAIKVLDMIVNACARNELFSITYQDGMIEKLERQHGLGGVRELIGSVFQMPQDSEV